MAHKNFKGQIWMVGIEDKSEADFESEPLKTEEEKKREEEFTLTKKEK